MISKRLRHCKSSERNTENTSDEEESDDSEGGTCDNEVIYSIILQPF